MTDTTQPTTRSLPHRVYSRKAELVTLAARAEILALFLTDRGCRAEALAAANLAASIRAAAAS